MPTPTRSDVEALIRAEIERSVAAYKGVAPRWMLPKLREIAERYWREHPDAVRALRLVADKRRLHSGELQTCDAEPTAAARKEGA